MATAPGIGSPRGKLCPLFNDRPSIWLRTVFPEPAVLINRDIVERPGVRIHVTADIGIFRRQPPVRVRENAGGFLPLVMVGSRPDISGTLRS